MVYTHEQHTVHLIVYNIIWYPKRRRKVLTGKVAERLEQIIREVGNENEWEVPALSIQPDHVHLFIRANPYTLPTDIARFMKGRSSHVLRDEFPHLMRMPSLWTRSMFYSTAGNVSAEVIEQYIERQSKSGHLILPVCLDGKSKQIEIACAEIELAGAPGPGLLRIKKKRGKWIADITMTQDSLNSLKRKRLWALISASRFLLLPMSVVLDCVSLGMDAIRGI